MRNDIEHAQSLTPSTPLPSTPPHTLFDESRKLHEYANLQRIDFKSFPPLPEGVESAAVSMLATPSVARGAALWAGATVAAAASRPNSRKQTNPGERDRETERDSERDRKRTNPGLLSCLS